MDSKQKILENFLNEQYEQIICEKCITTFLTNVYDFDETHVLLEKRSLGLEYFCHAITEYGLACFPDVRRIGTLDEDGNILESITPDQLYEVNGDDFEHRIIYVIEKMEHLVEKDEVFFNEHTQDLEWEDDEHRKQILSLISEKYGENLEKEIELLFQYYKKHEKDLHWDLHGDNLMKRVNTGEILIIDPFAHRV